VTEYMPGGRRRIDRVLAPEYLDGLGRLSIDEVRDRRAEADQEEVDLSYARRLLQGRVDILRSELERRRGGEPSLAASHDDAAIVAALTRVLTDEPPRHSRGGSRYLTITPSRVGEHRREAERAVADIGGSDLDGMDDRQLEEAIERLGEIETRVSRSRRRVQEVVDLFSHEVARRYRLDEASLVERG
jgi:hypothetical protein